MEAQFLDPDNWTTLAMLLAPGFLILGIRARFKEGAVPDLKDRAVSYAAVSAVYYAALRPLFEVPGAVALPDWLWAFLYYFIVPCVIGFIVVISDQKEWFYRQANRFGLKLTHHMPAAWDYAFSNLKQGNFLLVRLDDGTEYAGRMGANSFASSNGGERDLYLEEVWVVRDDGPWEKVEPERGVLLCGKDIQVVEIFD